ncbi:pre-mRNA 3'-end-processing factor FIP1 isoform X2 [Octopus sinensis]|uniref:Pre-mRNA 3'-end-processing factor FIP1 isoform X2 n=1 Tax=Octopus sinensis TaxID=2607531 RepID=A0A6P7T1E4_9MOLL|nr:pre-mRNA 3'-end-processing factor FIP1 isoform X2 [Octopus sinensis]
MDATAPPTVDGVEDDDAWLYGDSESKENSEPPPTSDGRNDADESVKSEGSVKEGSPPSATNGSSQAKPKDPDDKEAGELSGEEDLGDRKEDDDSDDDDLVQVTIGDIKSGPSVYETPRIFKQGTGYNKSSSGTSGLNKPQGKGIDLEAVGTNNGVPTYDFDFDSLQAEDKPWRKPGADITDYFNYGFNEDTWQQYCEKQRRLRMENQTNKIMVHHAGAPTPVLSSRSTPEEKPAALNNAGNAPVSLLGKRAAPPPNRKMSGTIDVIGTTARDSRRPAQSANNSEPIPTTDSNDYRKPYPAPSGIQPHHPHLAQIPEYGLPPPGMPPPGMPPPGMPPPPGVAMIPPAFPVPPPTTDGYDSYYQPQNQPSDRNSSYEERQSYNYDNNHPYSNTYSNPPPHWENRHPTSQSTHRSNNFERWDYNRDRSPQRESDYNSGYRRDRERERDRERDRSWSRDRERTREHRHRDREDRHRSRRKHRDEEETNEHHRSKHKKAKKSKREKEEEGNDSSGLAVGGNVPPEDVP